MHREYGLFDCSKCNQAYHYDAAEGILKIINYGKINSAKIEKALNTKKKR